jgi:hypothetical protein
VDHIKVLKRAFHITWNYKTLWIFGIILALTVGGGYNPSNPGSPDSGPQPEYTFEGTEEIPENIELPDGREVTVPQVLRAVTTWIAIGVTLTGLCCCAVFIWIVVATVARYVAETALIRMVDDYEETGEKRTIREGFRMGWSRTSLHLFLIDLLVFVASIVVFLPLIILLVALVGLSIAAIEALGAIVLGIIGFVAATGLLFLIILLGILSGVAVEFVKPFFQRACVMEGLGVIDSIKHALSFVKRHFAWDIVIMWLIVVGLNFAWIIAMFIVTLLLLLASAILASIPALMVGGVTGLIFGWIVGLIVGGIIGILAFCALMCASTTFLEGLRMTFLSSLWTLTYRELRALEGLEAEESEPWEAEDSHELH